MDGDYVLDVAVVGIHTFLSRIIEPLTSANVILSVNLVPGEVLFVRCANCFTRPVTQDSLHHDTSVGSC